MHKQVRMACRCLSKQIGGYFAGITFTRTDGYRFAWNLGESTLKVSIF